MNDKKIEVMQVPKEVHEFIKHGGLDTYLFSIHAELQRIEPYLKGDEKEEIKECLSVINKIRIDNAQKETTTSKDKKENNMNDNKTVKKQTKLLAKVLGISKKEACEVLADAEQIVTNFHEKNEYSTADIIRWLLIGIKSQTMNLVLYQVILLLNVQKNLKLMKWNQSL